MRSLMVGFVHRSMQNTMLSLTNNVRTKHHSLVIYTYVVVLHILQSGCHSMPNFHKNCISNDNEKYLSLFYSDKLETRLKVNKHRILINLILIIKKMLTGLCKLQNFWIRYLLVELRNRACMHDGLKLDKYKIFRGILDKMLRAVTVTIWCGRLSS